MSTLKEARQARVARIAQINAGLPWVGQHRPAEHGTRTPRGLQAGQA